MGNEGKRMECMLSHARVRARDAGSLAAKAGFTRSRFGCLTS